ncbi:DNA repair protein RecO [Dietzia sp.]|uniref:DNA repair protein RecO n=1 Tax=Dietzia sp. TaxID=1871616 RepID=UPI002FD9D9AF
MHPVRDSALVLRTCDLGEADRIITLLCLEHGIVRGVAKAVRRTRSKFGSRLEPFTYVEVEFVPSRRGGGMGSGSPGMVGLGTPFGDGGLAIIRNAETIEGFSAQITADWPTYTAACAMLEAAEHLAGGEPRILRMLVLAFRSIAESRREPALVAASFVLRALQVAGWEPVLLACARCGVVGPHRAYHVPSGGAVCVHCRPAGSLTPRQGVPETLDALLHGRWKDVEAAPEQVIRQSKDLVAAHLQWHTERSLHTLELLSGESGVRRHARYGGGPAAQLDRREHPYGAPA